MTSLNNDAAIQLAFSVFENRGVFALLLGSGISRAAQIPTGWEITLDLVRRVALAQGESEQPDWAAWYREKTAQEPNYSILLKELASSQEERRAIVHRYIEPNEEDRREGRKLPTAAHHAIAELIESGYIRVIVTTNFDRLMENALRERGIEPTVVTSVDALRGAEPLTHTSCYILKLHGDYKDARILNTDEELNGYASEYDGLLDRIFDEHGLVVCGWSGEWDHALRAAFLRAPNRRYSVFWAACGQLGDGAQELVHHRAARVVTIPDADGFFKNLVQRVTILEETHQQNPRNVDMLIGSAKRQLARPEFRIQLDELFSDETERVEETLDNAAFNPNMEVTALQFSLRARKYEASVEALACMLGVLGRWGSDIHSNMALDVITALVQNAAKQSSGLVVYLNLRRYPAVLAFTAYCLGLTRATRWQALHQAFNSPIDIGGGTRCRMVDALFQDVASADNLWQTFEGLQQAEAPVSNHLYEIFRAWSKRFAGLDPDFEATYACFEVLGGLAHLESNANDRIQQALALIPNRQQNFVWFPLARVAWDSSRRERLLDEIQASPLKDRLLEAGFAKSDPEFLRLFIQNFKTLTGRRALW